jgi:serine/threonine protein kinase
MTESILLSEEILGSGSYGDVFYAQSSTSGQKIACKRGSKFDTGSCRMLYGTVREILFLNSVPPHPNLVTATHRAEVSDPAYVYQPLELMRMNIKTLLRKSLYFQPVHAIYITREVLRALLHMREWAWVHRDIKLENILINSNGEIKLCDFSLSRISDGQVPSQGPITKMTSYVCTRYTRAPECFYHEKMTRTHA